MILADASRLAVGLMEEHGLSYPLWTFEFDSARRRFGQCRMQIFFGEVRWGRISLSIPLTELNTPERVRETILHEIAHGRANTAAGRNVGHSAAWRNEARRLGIEPRRCYLEEDTSMPPLKYMAVCPNGHTSQRARAMKPGRKTSCGRCSPVFSEAYLLEYKPNPEYHG